MKASFFTRRHKDSARERSVVIWIILSIGRRIRGDTQVLSINSQDLNRFLVWKATEYVPIRKNGKTLSCKKIIVVHSRLST